jgi:hypothetical protein
MSAKEPGKGRRLRDWLKRNGLRRLFELGQRVGIDLLPRHYYSEIPSIRELRETTTWREPRSLEGVDGADPNGQLGFLASVCEPQLLAECDGIYERACAANGAAGYGPIEATVLYLLARSRRPSRVVQVGAGVSTAVLLEAREGGSLAMEITCIDPFPTDYLRGRASAGEIELLATPAQEVPIERLASLGAGDLLFVDSTHTVKPGSEVNRTILDVLPRLTSGVLAHFHDVLFPYDYSPTVLDRDLFFWNETVLLHAFLAGNSRWRLLLSLSQLHHQEPEQLRALLPSYRPAATDQGLVSPGTDLSREHLPSSAYLEVMG